VVAVPFAEMFRLPDLAPVWWWVAAATFAVVLDKVLLTWMVREKRYKALAARNFLQGVGQAGFQVGFGYAPFKSVGLLIGWILGRVVALGGLFSGGGLFAQGVPRPRDLADAWRRYRRFPLVASWAALLNVLGQQAPFLLLGAYYGQATLGLIGMTTRVLTAPVTLIGQAVSRVFQGEGSEAIRLGTKPLRPILRANVKALSAISLPIALILTVVSPPLFSFALGAQWREAGVYAQILAFGYAAQLIVSPISQTLLILEKQGAQLAWDASRMVVTVGGPLLAAILGASPTVAVATLSAGFVVCYGALWWTCHRIAGRYDRSLPGPAAGAAS
jgi:O-antigen/teichoic acid export membrane protein